MRQFLMNRHLLIVLALVAFVGCSLLGAPNAESQLIFRTWCLWVPHEEFVPPTPTPVPNIANLTEEEIVQGLDASLVALLADADPAQGQHWPPPTDAFGCHMLDPNQDHCRTFLVQRKRCVDPLLLEEGLMTYIYHSIIAPNDYVVAGYNAGVMPQTYVDTLNDEQLMNIVSYLLTLRRRNTVVANLYVDIAGHQQGPALCIGAAADQIATHIPISENLIHFAGIETKPCMIRLSQISRSSCGIWY
ncbi:MAG: hypothetical protein R2856_00715 [Caldilineaceae bacterium]